MMTPTANKPGPAHGDGTADDLVSVVAMAPAVAMSVIYAGLAQSTVQLFVNSVQDQQATAAASRSATQAGIAQMQVTTMLAQLAASATVLLSDPVVERLLGDLVKGGADKRAA